MSWLYAEKTFGPDISENGEVGFTGCVVEDVVENVTQGVASDVTEIEGTESEYQPAELSFEQRCDILEDAIARSSLHREILYKTLVFCIERRGLSEVEAEIATYPEFKLATQAPYHLIRVLEETGGLDRIEHDEMGAIVTSEQREGLTEDEIDDLVWSYSFETTALGRAVIKRHESRTRIFELLDIVPERKGTYIEVMRFCQEEPRTYKEIEEFFAGRDDALFATFNGQQQSIQPSVFLDKLEKAAGVVWDEGWILTQGGEEILEELERV